MNNYDLSPKSIMSHCCQIIRARPSTTLHESSHASPELSDGSSYESAIRQLSHDDQWRNDTKLIIACGWYLKGVKQIDNFHFLHGALYSFYIKRWHYQAVMADTLAKLGACTHAVTIKFRYNYKRHECIDGGSHFIRVLCNELDEHGNTLNCGFAVGEPDQIPALRDQSMHFHMGFALSLPLDQQELDKHISHTVESMDSERGKVVHVGPTHTSLLKTPESVRGWELYASKSAQELGHSALSNAFMLNATGLTAL